MAYKGGPDWVFCPMVDCNIENIDCLENRDCVNMAYDIKNKKGASQEVINTVVSYLPSKYRIKEDYVNICKNCKWHNF